MSKPLIIITGASSGLGAAMAQVFAAADYPVALLARRLKNMENLNLPNSICLEVDVTNIDAFKNAITMAQEKFGPIDCLINNAGIALPGDFATQTHEEHANTIAVNLQGTINGIECVLADMRARKKGTIINISSLADRKARPQLATYAATKAAVKSLSESLRMDNAKFGIRICNVAPAKIFTPMWDPKDVEENQKIEALEFAKMVLWIYQQPQAICIRDFVVAPTYYEP